MSEEGFGCQAVVVACECALLIIAFQAVVEIWRVAYNAVVEGGGLVCEKVAVDNLDSFVPWGVLYVFFRFCCSGKVNLDAGDFCFAALCCHDCYKSAACACVENIFSFFCVEPCAKKAAVGANLHCASILLNGELFEFEIVVRHLYWLKRQETV